MTDLLFRACRPVLPATLIFVALVCSVADAATSELRDPAFVASQATAGKLEYARHCASCHGANLDDGRFAPPLRGRQFSEAWGGKPLDQLLDRIRSTMPADDPGSLGTDVCASVLAFMLQQNNVPAGPVPLPEDSGMLASMALPAAAAAPGSAEPVPRFPAAPTPSPDPLAQVTPVTAAMLENPPSQDWLSWRRTGDALGFSPLKQINRSNVKGLRLVWAWALHNGLNESTPLIHDGVMFVYSHEETVQALNAATGDLLWQYSYKLSQGAASLWKRAMAIAGERLYVATSDAHLVALDIKTGTEKWDSPVGDPAAAVFNYTGEFGRGQVTITGGPLVAKGKVIVGTTGLQARGNLIVAFDAETGKEAWRFSTVAQPGEPGADTWNDLPADQRSGGGVWTPGSYDPALNLVFFGPAPTYDTKPLRDRKQGSQATNSALYTDSTVALDVDTGKLKWYYQHMPNDQWNFDWAFERMIVNLPVAGTDQRIVVTAGKPAIYDALDAGSGKYIFSIDLGIQNLVTAIDPNTGDKQIDRSRAPGDGTTKFICPNNSGGKSWTPAAYDPERRLLFVPVVESCMDMVPVAPGETGEMSTGTRPVLRARPDSDGRYGRLEAINLATRRSVWTNRQRAPQTTGVLATAGGLVFAGALDRNFTAYDSDTGEALWHTRLSDVPNSNAVTYSVDGKQYLAVISGNGGPYATAFASFVPEIKNPPNSSANVWVFALPATPTRTASVH